MHLVYWRDWISLTKIKSIQHQLRHIDYLAGDLLSRCVFSFFVQIFFWMSTPLANVERSPCMLTIVIELNWFWQKKIALVVQRLLNAIPKDFHLLLPVIRTTAFCMDRKKTHVASRSYAKRRGGAFYFKNESTIVKIEQLIRRLKVVKRTKLCIECCSSSKQFYFEYVLCL